MSDNLIRLGSIRQTPLAGNRPMTQMAPSPTATRVGPSNPDLVFGDIAAVGDVKYKLMSGDWSRSDLNQIVAFAAAARTDTGIVVGFHLSDPASLPAVGVGDFHIVGVNWRAAEDADPALASEELAIRVRSLLPTHSSVAAA